MVSVDESSGATLLDAPDASLTHLRRKVEFFADDSKVSPRTGERRSARAVGPIAGIVPPGTMDLAGPRIQASGITPTEVRWFEIACRGGYLSPDDTARSRTQIEAASHRLELTISAEYLATERAVWFVRMSLAQLEQLIRSVDCIFEFDLATPAIRDWLLFTQGPGGGGDVQVTPPSPEAPIVVILDTGIATAHPFLQPVLRFAGSVLPGEPSPEDTHGHGTQMAGIAAFDELGDDIDRRILAANHWLESVRLLVGPQVGTATEDNRPFWPAFTRDAVEMAEGAGQARRVFVMAVTADLEPPGQATFWSHAVDTLAHNSGLGRLFVVCIGNAGSHELTFLDGYPQLNLNQRLMDPSQAVNALTVGAYTTRTVLPPNLDPSLFGAIAPTGGICPHTRCGLVSSRDGIKPDVVFEGGNIASDGTLPEAYAETLVALTTGHQILTRLLAVLNGTSEAAAHAAWFLARVVRAHSNLRPETIRALTAHAADWTPQMIQQFPNVDERLAACGYGVPQLSLAMGCAERRATVIIEDEMPNAVPERRVRRRGDREIEEDGFRRMVRVFRLPLPEDLLLSEPDSAFSLRVTLSYFTEPNTFRGQLQRGLDLRWDMQGPQETEQQFLSRINRLARGEVRPTDRTRSFDWVLGIRRRSRGTLQSDRWAGTASYAAGPKLIAVYPALGWWDRREDRKLAAMRFALVVTAESEALSIYTPISAEIAAPITIET